MDGLQLTCEFKFNKKEKMEIVAAAVFAVLYCCPVYASFKMGGG